MTTILLAQAAQVTPTPTGIAILTVCSGILLALIKGYVELRKARVTADETKRAATNIQHEVHPNSGSSMRDSVNRIEGLVTKIDEKVDSHAERLARLETKGGRSSWLRSRQ